MVVRVAKGRSSDGMEPSTMLRVLWGYCGEIEPLDLRQSIFFRQVKHGSILGIQLEVAMRGFVFVMFCLDQNGESK